MRTLLIALTIGVAVSSAAYGQQACKDPDFRATFAEKFREIGASHPDFLQDATVILNRSSYHNVQWVGLYREGPVSGALLAYDCKGTLLSIERMGGVKSIAFYSLPRAGTPAVAVEDIETGTGFYSVGYTLYGLIHGKIAKIWEHTILKREFVIPSENGIADSFEIFPSGYADPGWKAITVHGVRRVYPPSMSGRFDYRVETLPIESYCWSNERNTYSLCKSQRARCNNGMHRIGHEAGLPMMPNVIYKDEKRYGL
jgi:hypothetical protein